MLLCLTFLLTLPVAISGSYTVDVQIYTEKKILTRSNKGVGRDEESQIISEKHLRDDAEYFMSEVRKYFRTLKEHNLDINIRFGPLIYVESDVLQKPSLSAKDARKGFRSWLHKRSEKFDIAILWTNSRMHKVNNPKKEVLGTCSTGNMSCGKDAIGIVWHSLTYETLINTVREIALILGAEWDKYSAGYIMSEDFFRLHNSPKRWSFSDCSAWDLKRVLKERRCLWNRFKTISLPDDDVRITSGLEDPNEVCQRMMSRRDVTMCMSRDSKTGKWSHPTGDRICRRICCEPLVKGRTNKRRYTFSPEGVLCNVGRRCHKGRCKADMSGRSYNGRPASCPFGDQKVIGYMERQGQSVRFVAETCHDAMSKPGRGLILCQPDNKIINHYDVICCKTCYDLNTTTPTSSQFLK